jgi:hypothetical protein
VIDDAELDEELSLDTYCAVNQALLKARERGLYDVGDDAIGSDDAVGSW